METRSAVRSDWMYIKSAIDYFYRPRTFALDKIFASSKGELIKQDKKLESKKNDKNREFKIIIVADYDREEEINDRIKKYCEKQDFDLVWMNLDVEDVFLGKQIKNKDKKTEAIKFQARKLDLIPKLKGLENPNPLTKRNSTNLLLVLDKYIERN